MVISVIQLTTQPIYGIVINSSRSVLWIHLIDLILGPVERVLLHLVLVILLVDHSGVRMRSRALAYEIVLGGVGELRAH